MSSKLTLGFLLALTLTGCWSKDKGTKNEPDTFGFFKSEGAQEACVSTNLSQWGMNGPFLHRFLRCASNQSVDGAESLKGLQSLLASLDESKLQRVLDFVLSADPGAATHEERYPYLLAVTTVLDRGLFESKAQGLNLTGERLDTLQSFLATLDGPKAQDILSRWSRSGQLAALLNELGTYVNGLEADSLEVATYELLAGQTVRSELIGIGRSWTAQNKLWSSLSTVLSHRSVSALSAAERTQLLAPHRESLLPSDAKGLASVVPTATSTSESPLSMLTAEHQKWSAADLKLFSTLALSLWDGYRGLSSSERASLDLRLSETLESLGEQQATPLRWLMALLQDADQLSAKDLDKLSFAADQLLLEGNNISLEAIRAKVGATKLMDNLAALLAEGGDVPGCPMFARPLLSGDQSYEAYTQSLSRASVPQAECGGRIPLVAAIESILGARIGGSCGNGDVCLGETQPLADTAVLWTNAAPADPALTRSLVIDTLLRLEDKLKSDPYALVTLHLSRDRLSVDRLAAIRHEIEQATDWSSEGLATLDLQISERNGDILQNDFLENALAQRLEILASLSHQFEDLAPEDAATFDARLEGRAARVFAGLYNDGPMEQLLGTRTKLEDFPFTADEEPLRQYLSQHPSVWNRILSYARSSDALFRSPELGTLPSENNTVFSSLGGSFRNYLTFAADANALNLAPKVNATTANRILQPMQAFRSFVDDTGERANWALWYQHYANGPLVAKDVPAELSAQLTMWFYTSFLSTISSDAYWPELAADAAAPSQRGLTRSFYDVEDYSPVEARVLSYYVMKQQQKIEAEAPRGSFAIGKQSLPTSDQAAFADPLRGFFNANYLVRDDYEAQYSVFARLFPDALRNGSKLSEIKSSLLPADLNAFNAEAAQWKFAEQGQVSDASRITSPSSSRFALLSTLDLLTYSRPDRSYLPQPVIGFGGKLCVSKVKDPANATVWIESEAACPIDLQGSTPEEAYTQYKAYVEQLALAPLCPLISGDSFGSRTDWQQRLGLAADGSCTLAGAGTSGAYRFPVWQTRQVLADVFTMGKSARLKTGLAQLPGALRFYKLRQQGIPEASLASSWLRSSSGVWSELSANSQRRRSFFASKFWAGQPSLVNGYLTLIGSHVDAYAWRTLLIAYAEQDSSGQARDTVRDLLRLFSREQKAAAEKGQSFTELAMTLIAAIGQSEEYRSFLASGLAHMNTVEAYDFFANELALATITLFPEDQNSFDWNDPGLRLTKYFGQASTLQTWKLVGERFSATDLSRFFAQLHETLAIIPEPSERARILRQLNQEVLGFATLYDPASARHVLDGLDEFFVEFNLVKLGQGVREQWRSLVDKLDLPLSGLDGQEKSSGAAFVQGLIRSTLERGPATLYAFQKASPDTDGSYWSQAIFDFLSSSESDPEGARAFAGFLGEERLQFADGGLWMALLKSGTVQDQAIAALGAIESVPQRLWQAALLEATEVSSRLSKALNYLRTRIIWKEDPEHNAYRIALDQAYELSQDAELREKQTDLLNLWLRDEDTQPSP